MAGARAGRGAHRALEARALAAAQKKARRLGAYLVFVDESGFRLIPTVCKTWAPRGHTPRISHRYRHDRISVISGVSLSAVRHRVGLYFRWHRKNIQRPEVVAFVRHLLRHLPGDVIVVWDNNSIHKGEPLDRLRRRCPRLHIEFFPAYAPELNPDEGVWAQAKHRLANGRPDDLAALSRRLTATLRRLHRSPHRLRRCLHQTGLPFFQ